MSRKRFSPEQIIGLLREADVKLSQGRSMELLFWELGSTEHTYYRWRREYGEMKVTQPRRLKDLEKENTGRREMRKRPCDICRILKALSR